MKRRVMPLIGILLAVYCVCYVWQFLRVNREHGFKHVNASEIPEECLCLVELYGQPPEKVDVIVFWQDIDGDGMREFIVDAGEYARGAANCNYEIWREPPSGKHEWLGSLFADEYWVFPPWTIVGHPSILCVESNGECKWARWNGESYLEETEECSP